MDETHNFLLDQKFLLDGALDQIKDIIVAVDQQNNVIYLNKAAAKQHKIDQNRAIGMKLTQLYRQLWVDPNDEHQASILLKEKGFWEGVTIQLQPDGSKKVMESSINLLKSKSGEQVGLLSITRDITNRVNVDKWLVESNQRLKYVVEAAGLMVYEIDCRTNQITVIRGLEELLGYSVGEVPVTIDWWDSQIHPDDRYKAQEQFHPTKPVEKVVNEYRIRHKDGTYTIVRGIAKVITDPKGNAEKIIGTMQDISKEKDIEKQLQDNLRLATIGQTAGMVGHDIRNPLQSIIGDLFIVKSDIEELKAKAPSQATTEAVTLIDTISENLDYINRIVADLQDYSKNPEPKMEKVDISKITEKGLARMKIPSNIDFQLNLEPNLDSETDPAYIRRVLTNLTTNGIQAMPNGGKLIVEAKHNNLTKKISRYQ